MSSTDFKFSSPQPPSWVCEAFARMGPKYSYIAEYFNEKKEEFIQPIVAEIEKSLPGTQNTTGAMLILTPHEQKVIFMMQAISHADYFRPIPKEIVDSGDDSKKDPSISRHRAKDALQMQKELKKQIATTAKSLASQLRQHYLCSNQLGMDWIECDPFTLSMTADNSQQTQKNLLLKNEYDLALARINLVNHPELFLASLLDRLEKISSEPSGVWLSVNDRLGLGSRKTTFHFMDSFSLRISEQGEDGGGCMPDNFHLSNKCWAVLSTCLLNHKFYEQDIAMFWNRENKRIESMLGEKFSTEMFEAILAKKSI
jgi:hypothetical protein